MDNTNNKDYWDDYVSYWEYKVEEANNDTKTEDKTADNLILEKYYKELEVKETDKLLDYGCGSGRLYPIYKKYVQNNNYFGIDISRVSLEHAQKRYEGLMINKNIIEFDGIHIPFDENFFDKIVCYGVFDACNQEIVIEELLRVLNIGGMLLLTGKNKQYFSDDHAALIAEVNARKKGHPNYFTDVEYFSKQLLEHNVQIVKAYYFLRRGDFPKDQMVYDMPDRFYEWMFILKKWETNKYKFTRFSDKFSEIGY